MNTVNSIEKNESVGGAVIVMSMEDRIKTMREEDFACEQIYNDLYYMKSNFQRNNMEYLMEVRAESLGGKKLLNLYKSNRKSVYEKLRQSKGSVSYGTVEGQTNYTDLPDGVSNLLCGPNWIASDEGVFQVNSPRGNAMACRQPVLIKEILLSLDTGEEKLKLLVKTRKQWREIVCDKDTLSSTNKVLALHKFGVSITSQNAKEFVAFIQDMEDYSTEKNLIPVVLMSSKLGWNREKTVFLPYTDSRIEFDSSDKVPDVWAALQEKGSREQWYEEYKKLRGIPMLDFLTAASLSAPLVSFLPQTDGFVANIYGPSRGGKSLSNYFACSIWAGYKDEDGFICSVDNTNNFVEGMLNVLSNVPLLLEDANNKPEKDKLDCQSLIMKISNRTGRGRMRKDLGLRKVYHWCTTALITSENRITKDCHNTGSVNRVLMMRGTNEKECPYKKESMDIGAMLDFFENNHGFAGKDFVQALLEIGKENLLKMLKEIQTEVQKKTRELKKSGGQIMPVCIMLLADRIAEEHLFKDGKRISVEQAIEWMTDADEADQYQRFYDTVTDWVLQNSSKFEGLGMSERGNYSQYWGRYFKEEEKVALLPSVLKDIASEYNVDIKVFIEYLDEKGLLVRDSAGADKKNIYSPLLHKGARMYVISMPDVGKEEEYMEEEMSFE